MPCEKPLSGYRPTNGGPVTFKRPQARTYQEIDIPCGQCILCRLEHARQWAVRITHEAQGHEENAFITLTYNDENLPEHSSLNYRHLQLFWKRLRKKIGKFRYYAVGEYGDENNRPHYHACIFGHAWIEGRQILRRTPSMLWTHPELEWCWGMGNVSIGALTFESAQYTASYVTKKLNNKRKYVRVDEETGELIALVQPRAFMSRRKAIALEWVEKWGYNTYAHDRVVINGREQKPPKFYDRWLKKKSEIAEGMIKEKRAKEATKLTEEQTHARARNAHAHAKSKNKTL
ncbi:replication initiator protein [Blackfly microvirus SF02]|uniref:Replication initiator protein n=1 Tax=Blackfly microvirus SF02 TaxID=2576452 RepID=A0A4P8PKJ4_9VIRU|nr:replication initiator protein [Blackfly microvirus SF02]